MVVILMIIAVIVVIVYGIMYLIVIMIDINPNFLTFNRSISKFFKSVS